MKLHKRSSLRKKKQFEVDVYCNDICLGRGRITDIHTDGAFISHCPGGIKLHDHLGLRLIINEKSQETIHLNGMVMRISDEGVGVLFSYSETEFRRLLKSIQSDDTGFVHNLKNTKRNNMLSLNNINRYMVDLKKMI